MHKNKLLLVLNPNAGSMNVPVVISKTKQAATSAGYELEIFKTTGNKDAQNIKKEITKHNFKRVVAAGGDGTINLVGSILAKTEIEMGFLSCGSANGLATAFEIPPSLEEQIDIAINGDIISMDIIKINELYALHIADLGINAELIYNYDQRKLRGKIGYLLNTIPTLFKANYPYRFNLHFENNTIRKKGILLAFANASKFGTGAIINPKGVIDDGKFEVIVFKRFAFWSILKTFFKNNKLENSFAESYSVAKLEVTCPKPIALQIDGEFIGSVKNVSLKIIPNCLKVAVYKKVKYKTS